MTDKEAIKRADDEATAKFLAAVDADHEADPLRTIEVSVTEFVTETFTVYVDIPADLDPNDVANYDKLAGLVEAARVDQSDRVSRYVSVDDVYWQVKKGQ